MDLNIFIVLPSPAYKNITFYGSSHNSHNILKNWLTNVDNFVQRQSALLNISLYKKNKKKRLGGGTFPMFLGGLTPLQFGKL